MNVRLKSCEKIDVGMVVKRVISNSSVKDLLKIRGVSFVELEWRNATNKVRQANKMFSKQH